MAQAPVSRKIESQVRLFTFISILPHVSMVLCKEIRAWLEPRASESGRQANHGKNVFTRRGVLKHPFSETWMTPTLSRPPIGNCNWKWPHNTTIIATDMNVNRTVDQHDGVIDMVIREVSHTEGVLIIRLEFAEIQNLGEAFFSNIYQQVPSGRTALMTSVAMQDDRSRVTVLCYWPTKAFSPSQGIIQIEVQSNGEKELLKDEIRMVRIIPEDVDPLRDVSTEYSLSPYAKRMMEDFFNPLELFVMER